MTVDKELIRRDFPDIQIAEFPTKMEFTFEGKKVVLDKETIESYEDALNRGKPKRKRLMRFLTAQNKAGRRAKIIKDAVLMFLPFGKKISNVSEMITHIIRGNMEPEPKPAYKSKTVVVFGLLFITGLLQLLGVLPQDFVELSPDAIWVQTAAGFIGTVLRLVTKQPVNITSG